MKNQVTTIEQSKRLMELGMQANKASIIWFRRKISPNKWGYWELILGTGVIIPRIELGNGMSMTDIRIESNEVVPACTVADLLEMMPKTIEGNKGSYDITMTINDDKWMIYYQDYNTGNSIGCNDIISLIDLLCDRIEWLVSNGYKLNV